MLSLVSADVAPRFAIHVLFTHLETGLTSLIADGVMLLSVALYLLGVRRLAARGRSWPTIQIVSFVVGVFLIFGSIGWGLAAYDDSLLVAHVVQHLFLMMVAPPLIALGRPVTLISQAAPRSVQVALLKFVNSRAIAVLSSPVSWAVYYGSMWVYFVTPLYRVAGDHPLLHDALHLYFFAIGYLFWQGIIGLDIARHRVSHPMRIVGLLVGAPLEAFLGLTIMSMSKPIAPGYSLGDTHNGGAVFWITSMIVMAIAAIVALRQWVRSEDRRAARLDIELARPSALGLSPEQEAELRRIAAPGRPIPGESR